MLNFLAENLVIEEAMFIMFGVHCSLITSGIIGSIFGLFNYSLPGFLLSSRDSLFSYFFAKELDFNIKDVFVCVVGYKCFFKLVVIGLSQCIPDSKTCSGDFLRSVSVFFILICE